MSRRRLSAIAALALASTLLASCSSGSPTQGNGNGNGAGAGGGNQPASQTAPQQAPQAAQPAADLCSVWTPAQVSAAVGGPAGPGTPQNDGKMCLWGDENTGANASIAIDDGQGYAATCQGSLIVKVDGIGDGACFLEGGDLGTSLEVLKGGRSWQFAVQKPQAGQAFVENAEKTLALEALPKL